MLKVQTAGNAAELSVRAAEVIAALLGEALAKKEAVNFVAATGSTPIGAYERLASHYRTALDWRRVRLFQMDEYVGLGSTHPRSFAAYLERHLVKPLGIQALFLMNTPDGGLARTPSDYEAMIAAHGGIDLTVLGIGENGHLGFNEPGSPFDSGCREVELAQSTLRANQWKDEAGNLVTPPSRAISLGLRSFSESATNVLLAYGPRKRSAIRALLHGPVTTDVPATVLRSHLDTTVIVDREAQG